MACHSRRKLSRRLHVVHHLGLTWAMTSTRCLFSARIGADVVRPKQTLDEAHFRLCGEVWGVGSCLRRMPADELTPLQTLKRRLEVWPDVHKRQNAKFDTLWGKLPLYYIGADCGAAASADDVRGHVVLLIFSEKRPTHLQLYGAKCH